MGGGEGGGDNGGCGEADGKFIAKLAIVITRHDRTCCISE